MNERDALIRAIKDEWHGVTDHSAARGMAESAADAVLASAAWRNRHQEPMAEQQYVPLRDPWAHVGEKP